MTIDTLYIVSTLRQSGPTNQLYSLLDHLSAEFDPFVLTLSPEPDDSAAEQFKDVEAEFGSLNLSRVAGATVGPLRLRSAVETIDPDLIHTQGIRADTLSAHFLRGYTRLTTIRNNPHKDYPAKYGELQGKVMAWKHLDTYRRLDRTVACSQTIADQVSEFGITADAIQNGVDCTQYQPASAAKRHEIRERLGLTRADNVVVFTGSLIPRKDPQTAIRGFLRSDSAAESTLVLLGDGPLRDDCESIAASHDNVRLEGWVDNVKEYLRAADCFLSPSKAEGLPNSVMEALATGLPVCLSDIGPHREILQYNPEAGTMFHLETETELATALDALLAETDGAHSQAAVEIAQNELSAKSMSENYQQLYKDAIGR
ncbi:glycosyltransferase [Natronococcus sp. A-GB1]|uniref:glycosyltransferase n=1 Tax=Natronococcus sp. A-GB1 TaxID=3037648 RepID=UPI00241F3794|nr:glycosyltransferase [Natronococcus sp. A-GB1]MDG5761745.1 glycosyltransferase [Natronococcus sp. A-GB1]